MGLFLFFIPGIMGILFVLPAAGFGFGVGAIVGGVLSSGREPALGSLLILISALLSSMLFAGCMAFVLWLAMLTL